ncbi:MAG TPA: MATE family efflux transporter [Clostridiales bacterium]|nr:MATE family efflux transporter [Clostridiales bacterium]
MDEVRHSLGVSLAIAVSMGLLFFVPNFLFPESVMSMFTTDVKVIELGITYSRIVAFTYIFIAITFAYAGASRSIERARMPMYASSIALILNTILSYILIYGVFIFPSLGLKGAAIAILISRFVEMTILISIIYTTKSILVAPIKVLFQFSKALFIKMFRLIIPIVLGDGLWILGTTACLAIYTHMGTDVGAAVHISNTIQNLFLIIFFGIASACGVMVGKSIGERDYDKTFLYPKKNIVLTITLAIISGVILILVSPFIVRLFQPSAIVYDYSIKILIVIGLGLFIRMYNLVIFDGIIKSGGDAIYSLILSSATIWLVGVPLVYIGAFVWKLPIYLVILLAHVEELVQAIITFRRFLSKKWIHNFVK